MKILLVTEFFPQGKDLRFSGGVEARTYFVAKSLAKKHDVHVICTRQKGSKVLETISGINVHRVGPTLSYSETASLIEIPAKIIFSFMAIKQGIRLKPDIVDGGNYIAHFITKQISLKNKIPSIFWYPDVFIGQWMTNLGKAGIFGYLLERTNLLRGATHFIAISKSTDRKLKEQKIDSKKISLIPCGVDLSEFRIKVKKDKEKKLICISRLASYKRTKDLILAFAYLLKKHPNLKLTIIGSGPEKNNLTNLSENLNIEKKVIFMQNLPREKLVRELKFSHLFCLPSAIEGFGISVLEAAAAGVPYVISDIEVFKEVTQNGKGGLLFKLGSAKDLADKIEKLIEDKNLHNKKVTEGRKLAEKYQWSKITRQTEEVYRKFYHE